MFASFRKNAKLRRKDREKLKALEEKKIPIPKPTEKVQAKVRDIPVLPMEGAVHTVGVVQKAMPDIASLMDLQIYPPIY